MTKQAMTGSVAFTTQVMAELNTTISASITLQKDDYDTTTEVMDKTIKNSSYISFSVMNASHLASTTEPNDEYDATPMAIDKNLRISFTEAQIVYMLIGSLGVFGNGLSIIVFVSSKKLKKNLTNHFLINQSLIDFVAALSLLATIPIGTSNGQLKGVVGYIRCVFWDSSLPVWASFLSSTYNLVALSIERWLQICHPILHKVYFSQNKAYSMMASTWIIGFAYEIILAVTTSAVINGECFALAIWDSSVGKQIYGVITFLTKYIAPIIIVICCYIAMMLALRPKASAILTNAGGATSNNTTSREERLRKAQKNIFKTLAIVVVGFIICVTYNQVIFLFFNLGWYQLDFTSLMYHLSVSLYFLNCCINPFIYMVKYQEFKRSLRSLFCRNQVSALDGSNADPTNQTRPTQSTPNV